MEPLVFQPAKAGDEIEILALYRSLEDMPGCTWGEYYPTMEIVKNDIEKGNLYTLRTSGGMLAGAIAAGIEEDLEEIDFLWKQDFSHPCELSRLGVAKPFQGQGLAQLLLEKSLAAANAKGYDGARLLVTEGSTAAIYLYEKNGFTKSGKAFVFENHFLCYERSLAI